MLSPVGRVVCVCSVSFVCYTSYALDSSSCSEDEEPNSFDKFFPDLTTEYVKDQDIPVYKMFKWRNLPTQFTQPPPPRFRSERTTRSTTTEEPDDGEGDYKIIPVPKVATNGHPFLDKDGKRIQKITKREVSEWNKAELSNRENFEKSPRLRV